MDKRLTQAEAKERRRKAVGLAVLVIEDWVRDYMSESDLDDALIALWEMRKGGGSRHTLFDLITGGM